MNAYESAKQIVKRLKDAGHIAYFAGGWVRDYLMGHPSSDIDIATDAEPEKVVALFPNTYSVGISFGVVVVLSHGHQFEVSSFRMDHGYVDGRRPSHITLTTPEEDAKRRDFTINGMFYDPFENEVIDYVNGRKDISDGIIRAIGKPEERFIEDRLRMIRAVRFTSRFNFALDPVTKKAIQKNANTLFPAVAMERVWQEFKKMTEYPNVDQAFLLLHELGLLQVIFPALKAIEITSFQAFPKSCPAILYLMELFPDASLEEQLEICLYLKTSNKEQKLVEFASQVRSSAAAGDALWARLYAHPDCALVLDVIAARLSPEQRREFLQEHKVRAARLKKHSARIALKQPLVTSSDLMQQGISSGKSMGLLLAEAEKIAIEQDLDDKKPVLDQLQKSPLWKTL